MVSNYHQVIEKRQSLRMRFEGQVIIATAPRSITLGEVLNVSYGGLKVKVFRNVEGSLQRGNKVNLTILKGYFNLEGEGEIAWISPDENMAGIKFNQLNEENRRFLEKFLRKLSRR